LIFKRKINELIKTSTIVLSVLISTIIFSGFDNSIITINNDKGPCINSIKSDINQNNQLSRHLEKSNLDNRSSQIYQFDLRSGWATSPESEPIPEPIKRISINESILNYLVFNFTLYNIGENATFGFDIKVPENWSNTPIEDVYYQTGENSTEDYLQFIIYPSNKRQYLKADKLFNINLTSY